MGNKKLPSNPQATTPEDAVIQPAVIRQLSIARFRGIKQLVWNPAAGLNVLLGGGDVGKTTILEAIALLLSPSNSPVISESDFYERITESGFLIEAVLSVPLATGIGHHQKLSWPWEWNGKEAVPPALALSPEQEIPSPETPVYRLRVRGTADLELAWEIIQPNDEIDLLSSTVRRAIGMVRLASDDKNDRDLRLVYGSALDRLLSDPALKARIALLISDIEFEEKLSPPAKTALDRLDKALQDASLPGHLQLGLTSSQGISLGALIGLHALKREDVFLPLASWGAGTRRMATLEIAAATQSKTRITVIDEVERGLEPYRLRKLIEKLQSGTTQTFVTTHSAVAISAAHKATLWYLDAKGSLGELEQAKIKRQQERDPETFLSRLAIIAEGPTEVGFISFFLERAISGSLFDHGIRVCDGQGTPAILDLLEALKVGGLSFGGFVDGDTGKKTRWDILKTKMGGLLFQWNFGCTEEWIIPNVEDKKLPELLKKGGADKADPLRRRSLADRLGIVETDIEAILAVKNLREVILAAATGNYESAPNPDIAKIWKKHDKYWFKSEEGGRELAEKVIALGLWPLLKPIMMPFLNAVRVSVGQPEIDDTNP
ncbi:hypothetical protein GCM10011487_44970 [Steroidobacter agaridevorans]|uniref:ATPase AAA-type core domain-containing protein n=1 Tax=Steroidobacter agaridevorans TaxID=2695856 RepID=A0A829YGQ3_9GAMM|nr:AAA family ATPase [Steroidobacter agaridevorans]GFE82497.1 hypothetical protein GCM10011487_44970 [Steroidobacter agaridevorans]